MDFELIPSIFRAWLQSAFESRYYDEDLVEELSKVRQVFSGVVERLTLRIVNSKTDQADVRETARARGAAQVEAITAAINALGPFRMTGG